MTKDEIKKALECCAKSYADSVRCSDCPYDALTSRACNEMFCQDVLCKDALVLITEQEKEIEYLKAQVEDVTNHADTFLEEANKFEAENKKLKAENERFESNMRAVLEIEKKQAKIDVLNELRERYASSGSVDSSWTTIIFVDDIDEMIEELKK